MYKLLIVDDEFNIRDGITHAIPWDSINVEMVGSAIDGMDALDKVEQLLPDIVITDVSMDNMDGLELSDIIRQRYPFIKIIILSGYDDFEYVRRALELRVYTYIMKPVRSKELIEIVKKLIVEIEDENNLRNKINSMETEISRSKSVLNENFLFDLVHGNFESRDELRARMDFLDLDFSRTYYVCLFITISDYVKYSNDGDIKELQKLIFSIREISYKTLKDFEIQSLISEQGNLTLITGCDSADEPQFRESLTKELEIIVEDVYRLLGLTVTATVGGIYTDLQDISKSFREALIALEHNSIAGRTSIIHINDIPAADGARYIYPVEKENALLRSLIDANEEKISMVIKELFDDMENQKCTKNRIRIDIMGLLGLISRKAMDMGVDMYQLYGHGLLDPYKAFERYYTREMLENWFRNIFLEVTREIRKQQTSNIKNVIKMAGEYLDTNYANPNLSLVSISDYLHLSPSYFSRLYKKETGESFVEALTAIRLEKAKNLLKQTNEKISAISESIGYTDSKYFCTLFKKYLGFTPIEYREI